jgi:hypothetical protein
MERVREVNQLKAIRIRVNEEVTFLTEIRS